VATLTCLVFVSSRIKTASFSSIRYLIHGFPHLGQLPNQPLHLSNVKLQDSFPPRACSSSMHGGMRVSEVTRGREGHTRVEDMEEKRRRRKGGEEGEGR
jgi:hypothetical protein